MADRPIIFSAPMIRALLAGTKSQTRRILKPRGQRPSLFDGTWSDSYVLDAGNAEWRAQDLPCAAGDRLWVRETWAVGNIYDGMAPRNINPGGKPGWCGIRYAATDERLGIHDRPSIHMPRWSSRLTLTVRDVRVQRLQQISEDDARAEGVNTWAQCLLDDPAITAADIDAMVKEAGDQEGSMRNAFAALWNNIHGPGAWQANPWVAAISFTVERRNVDA